MKKQVVYWCPKREDAVVLVSILAGHGIKFSDSSIHWDVYKEETCYFIEGVRVLFGNRDYCKLRNIHYKIFNKENLDYWIFMKHVKEAELKKSEVLDRIYYNLLSGKKYGKYITNVKYPMFRVALFYDGKYFCWKHYGSGADEATKENLLWILEKIFKLTPEKFEENYIIEHKKEDLED